MFLEYKIVYKQTTADLKQVRYSCLVDLYDSKRNINVVREYREFVKEHERYYHLMVLQINLLDDKKRFIKVIK